MSQVSLVPGLISLLRMAGARKEHRRQADEGLRLDSIGEIARAMHPERLELTVGDVREVSESIRVYRLTPREKELPWFLPGQYISVKLSIGGSRTARAYTISSAPFESGQGYYEITVRKKPGGFVSGYIFDNWAAGTSVEATGPHGSFYYQPLRDAKHVVAIAGGTGITPFVSMMREFARDPDAPAVTLLYGCRNEEDVLFRQEIDEVCAAAPERFSRFNTYDDNGGKAGLRQGFLDAAFIREHVPEPERVSFFVCGPQVMYDFLRRELPQVAPLKLRQMRYEVGGAPADVKRISGFPQEAAGRTVTLHIRNGLGRWDIPASAEEPVLTAVERAGLLLDSRCRSGECGICRSKLASGEVFILPDGDGRREADMELGYIHPCSSYPLSDAELIIPPGAPAQS